MAARCRTEISGSLPAGTTSYGPVMSQHPENYEDVTVYGLDDDTEAGGTEDDQEGPQLEVLDAGLGELGHW